MIDKIDNRNHSRGKKAVGPTEMDKCFQCSKPDNGNFEVVIILTERVEDLRQIRSGAWLGAYRYKSHFIPHHHHPVVFQSSSKMGSDPGLELGIVNIPTHVSEWIVTREIAKVVH